MPQGQSTTRANISTPEIIVLLLIAEKIIDAFLKLLEKTKLFTLTWSVNVLAVIVHLSLLKVLRR